MRALCRLSFVAYRSHVTTRTRDESCASLSWKSVLKFEPSRVEDLRKKMNQDKKTEKIEMLQSHEALYQKRREQAQARRNIETSEQRRIRLQRNRQRAARKPAKETTAGTIICRHRKRKRRFDREPHQQKRAEEATPERKHRLQAVNERVQRNETKSPVRKY